MVKTSDGVMDINPLERMDKLAEISEEKKNSISAKKKEFEELEKAKKKEIEDIEKRKKKELEDLESKKKKDLEEIEAKKKELAELEKKKAQEIEETEELIDKSFQELMRHKRILLEEDEEKQKERNLEAIAELEKGAQSNQPNYTRFFETLQAPKALYEINGGFYSDLKQLRNMAANGTITPEQEEFAHRLRERFEELSESGNEENNYLRRSMNLISQIDNYTMHR